MDRIKTINILAKTPDYNDGKYAVLKTSIFDADKSLAASITSCLT